MAEERSVQAAVATVGAAARKEAAAVATQVRSLDPARWAAPSWCEGWSVQDVLTHLTEGTERWGMQTRAAVAGEAIPEFSPAERRAREEQVRAMPPAEMAAELERRNNAFFDWVEGLPAADLSRSVVPRPGGRQATALDIAQLRLNELALHRWDVLAPTDPAARLDADTAALVMDYVLAGAGRLARGGGLEGLRAVFRCEASGPGGGPVTMVCRDGAVQVTRGTPTTADPTLHLRAEGLRQLPPQESAVVAVTVSLPAETLIRFIWGRVELERALAEGTIRVEGDRSALLALGKAFGNR